MREYGHMDILLWALASIGLDIVKWDQGTIIGKHTGTGFCINLLGVFIYVNFFNAFFLVKTIMKINMKQREEIPNSFKYQACVGGHQN
jgi:hypothetical protein